jgi:hypothetical protein
MLIAKVIAFFAEQHTFNNCKTQAKKRAYLAKKIGSFISQLKQLTRGQPTCFE